MTITNEQISNMASAAFGIVSEEQDDGEVIISHVDAFVLTMSASCFIAHLNGISGDQVLNTLQTANEEMQKLADIVKKQLSEAAFTKGEEDGE